MFKNIKKAEACSSYNILIICMTDVYTFHHKRKFFLMHVLHVMYK